MRVVLGKLRGDMCEPRSASCEEIVRVVSLELCCVICLARAVSLELCCAS